ncbi:MAG: hypothetical protein JWO89_2011 [Verrucomicrobiaceae bacterium]|nr:hypothetical protein [Verrucomicrobiaceae bacterium]
MIVLGLLAILMLALGLVFGWYWFFNERAKRELMARLATAATERTTLLAAQTASDRDAPPSAATLKEMAQDDVPAPMVRLAEPVASGRLMAASNVLQQFWHASTWTEKAAFVQGSKNVEPLLRLYYETQRNKDPISGALVRSELLRLKGRELLVLTYASDLPGKELQAFMVPGADGSYLLDWESYVGWGDLTFPEFGNQYPDTSQLMRVHARSDTNYQGEFANPNLYLNLELVSPDGLYRLHGYCEKNSPTGLALAGAVAGGVQTKLTLHLAYPEGGKSPETARITGLVADRWLVLK